MDHSINDAIGLRIARRVATRLRERPAFLELARRNLERWTKRNADSPSLLRCYAEWQSLLARPLEEVLDLLCAETDEGQRLRQSSPFAGILSPAEVWEIKREVRRNATQAA